MYSYIYMYIYIPIYLYIVLHIYRFLFYINRYTYTYDKATIEINLLNMIQNVKYIIIHKLIYFMITT